MKKVLIYVEGSTEAAFVENVLDPYLNPKERKILLQPITARTGETPSGSVFKGGIVSYRKVKNDILRLLNDASAKLVTTMIDFYGLPPDFPGKDRLPPGNPYQQVLFLEQEFEKDINNSRFLPYLSLHEFEALLFADITKIAQVVPNVPAKNLKQLQKAVAGRPPELIDDGANTHPSKLIERYIPTYKKASDGPQIANLIGIDEIRKKCPHFDEWIRKLERKREDP